MSAREPQEMAQLAAETGAEKVHRTWDRVLISAFLAGAYISFGHWSQVGTPEAVLVSLGWCFHHLGDATQRHGRTLPMFLASS
jgi:formate/nitrite transporter FocA (FNT family)